MKRPRKPRAEAASPPVTRPRKEPRQVRAAETVEAILEAAARLISQEGYRGATTNRVAERAGVSIGSLYQYFPNKEALLSTLSRRHSDRMSAVFESQFAAANAAPLTEAAREVVRAELSAHAIHPRLYSTLYELMPRLGATEHMEATQQCLVERLRQHLAQRPEPLRPQDLDMAAFLLFHAVRGVSQAAIRLRPELLSDPRFLEECATLVVGFLTPR